MITSRKICSYLDDLFPAAGCELLYYSDYELLIATVLSAQCTDKRVNVVTENLFSKYDIFSLAEANIEDIEHIVYSLGSFTKKAYYIKEIAKDLVLNYDGVVPNNREYLESLPGVGRKTCNVVLSNLFDVPAIAVDTHVERVAKRLNLANDKDSVLVIERKLMDFFPKKSWSRIHHQMVLFGRYNCKSISPLCSECVLKEYCSYYNKNIM